MSTVVAVRKRLREIYGENCDYPVSKADIKEANALKADAAKAVELALPFAQRFAVEIGLSGNDVRVAPTKTLARMFEKAVGKHDGHLEEINDTGRMRTLTDGPDNIVCARKELGVGKGMRFEPFHPDNHVTVTGVQDYFWKPSKTGRIALHIDMLVAISGAKSVGIEMQLVDRRMLETEKATHLNYQKASAIERAAMREGRFYFDETGKMQAVLNPDEEAAIEKYRESNAAMYMADALNYGYYNLRRPDLKTHVPVPARGLQLVG